MLVYPPAIQAPCPRGWLDAAKVAGAIKACHGVLTYAAKILGCSRQTIMNYCRDHAICRQAQLDAREEMCDFTEGQLFAAIQDREGWAVRLYLTCQAKHRGYVQSFQVAPDSAPRIEFRFCVAQPPATFSAGADPPTIDAEPVRAEAEAVPPPGDAREGDSAAEGTAE